MITLFHSLIQVVACSCSTNDSVKVNERFVAASVARGILAAFHCQLDAVGDSVEADDPRAAEQSSVCTGSG